MVVLSIAPAFAQSQVYTIQQAIDSALANGDQWKILQGSLEVTRALHALDVSHASLTLSGSAGADTESLGYGPTAIQSELSQPVTLAPGPDAAVTLSGPLTAVSLAAAPWLLPNNASGVTLTVSQTIWNGYPGGPQQATADKSLISVQNQELSTTAGRSNLIYSVKQAYYTMLGAQQTLAVNKQILEKQSALLAQTTATYNLQQASLVDLKTAQLNAQSAQVDVDSSQNDVVNARVALATLMGIPTDQDFTVETVPDPTVTEATLQDAVNTGLNQRVEIKQLQLSIQSSDIDLALAKGQGTPSVSLSGGMTMLLDWNGQTGAIGNAGVRVGLPILDSGTVKNQVDSIEKQQGVYATQEVQTRKSIINAIQSAWQGVAIAKERLDLAKLSAQTMELQYQLTVAERDQGTASNQDVFTASVNQATAETALAAASNTLQLSELQLQNAMGY